MTNERELAALAAAIDEQWPQAVDRAKQWQPGMMRSAWTAPLEHLAGQSERLLERAGIDPATIATPKKVSAEEKALPADLRMVFRRASHIRARLAKEVEAQQRSRARGRGGAK